MFEQGKALWGRVARVAVSGTAAIAGVALIGGVLSANTKAEASQTTDVQLIAFAAPVPGHDVNSPFGFRKLPWEKKSRLHAGVDIAVPAGTPIRAADGGTVVLLGSVSGYGNYTCIQHTGALSTCYAHQSGYATSQGASVTQGQVIGYVGCTGHCYGDHLHFETRLNGSPVDPMGYL